MRLRAVILTHKQASVGRPVDGEAVGGGVLLLDQVLGGALEVIKAVLFVLQRPRCRHTTVKKRTIATVKK